MRVAPMARPANAGDPLSSIVANAAKAAIICAVPCMSLPS
jgi:hypothetical protein